MHSAERATIMRAMSGEPLSTAAAAMKCGAALAILTLVAVIGSSGDDSVAPLPPDAVHPAAATATGGVSAAHRRQVFEERRTRRDTAPPPSVVLDAPAERTASAAP